MIAETTGSYFDTPAESNPLLNTWSLSVEEQFYFLFPAILLLSRLLYRRGARSMSWMVVGLVALVSFGLAVTGTDDVSAQSRPDLRAAHSADTIIVWIAGSAATSLMILLIPSVESTGSPTRV